MYDFAQWPSNIFGCTSTRIHVPFGVVAFQDAMSSLKPNEVP